MLNKKPMGQTSTSTPSLPPSLKLWKARQAYLNPESVEEDVGYSQYQDDPVGFGQDVLNLSYIPKVKQVMESVRDFPVTVATSANAVGKSHGAASTAAWFYKSYEDSQVYTAAAPPQENLKKVLWGEIGGLVRDNPELFAGDKVTTMNVERHDQSFITGVAIPTTGSEMEREAKFSGKHAPHLLFIVDEGDAVPEEVYRGIEGCMSGGHARLLVMYNPRHRSGRVWRMVRDEQANVVQLSALDHPNVVEGRDVIPGAVTRETTVRRVNMWTMPLVDGEKPDEECFEVPGYLVGYQAKDMKGVLQPPLNGGWRRVTDSAFWYMVLGEYPVAGEMQLISSAWINAARARFDVYVAEHGMKAPVGVKAILGQDVAEMGKDSNVACLRYGGYVAPMETWGGVDVLVTGDRAVNIYRDTGAERACVDATGIGSGVAPHMSRAGCHAVGVKVASSPTYKLERGEFRTLRDQLWWEVREWLRTDTGAMLPPDERLIEELTIPTYAPDKRSRKITVMEKATMREKLGRSPDRADALCLTFAPDVGVGGSEVESMSLRDFLEWRREHGG